MGETIIDGAGSGFLARVNSLGRLLVDADLNENPSTGYNPKTVLVYSGTAIGSIYKIDSIGSIVKVLGYDGSDNLISASEWVGV
jgi:hypothetical protein